MKPSKTKKTKTKIKKVQKITKKKSVKKKVLKKTVKKPTATTKKKTVKKSSRRIFSRKKAKEIEVIAPLVVLEGRNEKSTANIEPITFGLLEREVNEILDNSKKRETEQEIKKKVVRELVKMLPSDEAVVTSKSPKEHNIVIKNIRERHLHSPYVLNLPALMLQKENRKQKKVLAKEKVNEHLSAPNNHYYKSFIANRALISKKVELPSQEIYQQLNQPKTIWLRSWMTPALSFAVICLLTILPIKALTYYQNLRNSQDRVMAASQEGLDNLKNATKAMAAKDSVLADQKFGDAKMSFAAAQKEIVGLNEIFTQFIKIIPGTQKTLTDAKRLTWSGQQIAEIGDQMNAAYANFSQKENLTLTGKIITWQGEIQKLLPKIKNLSAELNQVDPEILPQDRQVIFSDAQEKLEKIYLGLDELNDFSDNLLAILGYKYERRYLFVFQNNSEIRATGGFMGSLALVDIRDGQIMNIEMPGGGTYDFQGGLLANLAAPYPLQLINSRWELQDANWFFDFPTSAQKITWFLEKSGGPSVDGVIAINATLMPKLLEKTAPIYLAEYGKTITAENFLLETQKSVELEYDKVENKPKQFLADLAPIFISQIFDSEKTDILSVTQILKDGLKQKDILIYFENPVWQEKISQYDWTGEIKATSKDYLAIVNTNIAGQKTDLKIKQTIDHNVEIKADGSVIDTLTINRTHEGIKGELFSGVNNVNFMRIFVPLGSQLIEASGFDAPPVELFEKVPDYFKSDETLVAVEKNKQVQESSGTYIYEEFGKTVFANWTQTDPQETATIILKYKLPYKLKLSTDNGFWSNLFKKPESRGFFSVFYQKQPGSVNTTVNSRIVLPDYLSIVENYPTVSVLEPDQFSRNFDFTADSLVGIILQTNLQN